jgi:DNA (cytosine-5)-methyltransferase 1
VNFYSDNEPSCVAWISALIRAGLIGEGKVDGRSIQELGAADLVGYRHVCLFAGIAGWELALRLAGWPDDRPVWTGSCPCPPFSQAGRKNCKRCGDRLGFYGVDDFGCQRCNLRDERHLWPEMRRLIALGRPPVCFGEQVASADGRQWLARVRVDLEALGYAVGCADLCAAGAGAPQIRQRLFWVARRQGDGREQGRSEPDGGDAGAGRPPVDLADRQRPERRPPFGTGSDDGDGTEAGRPKGAGRPELYQQSEHLADPGYAEYSTRREKKDVDGRKDRERPNGPSGNESTPRRDLGHSARELFSDSDQLGHSVRERLPERQGPEVDDGAVRQQGPAARAAGPWDDFEILVCDDGKGDVCFRRTQPGLRPLAARLPGRVAQLRGLGNSIVPKIAAEFVRAFLEAEGDLAP